MSFPIDDLPDIPVALTAEVKAFLRIDHILDDDAIAEFIRSAVILCEDFTGQLIMARTVTDSHPARDIWLKLKRLPVQSITSIDNLSSDGTAMALSTADYQTDIDSDGLGWVRINSLQSLSRVGVHYEAGLSADWDDIPATLRQGIVRLAGYLYANRDGTNIAAPPSAVTALWRPYRRMRLA